MDYWIDKGKVYYPSQKISLPLIHMTQEWEVLELILREGFKPSYCKEFITDDNKTKMACFPMVSLSNMSIRDAVQFQKSYGTYGIVLNKKWGQKNNFNPVLYLDRKSDLTKEIVNVFEDIAAGSISELYDSLEGIRINHKSILQRKIVKIFAHSKNYDGRLVRNDILYSEEYPFGLEREWRIIIIEKNIPYFLVGDDLDNKKKFNEKLEDIRIDFNIDDIEAVIIESDIDEENAKTILKEKFNIKDIPPNIKFEINRTRHIPDEG